MCCSSSGGGSSTTAAAAQQQQQQKLKIAREVPIAVVEPRLGPSSSSHQDNSNISGQNWPSRAAAAAEEEVVLQQQQQQQQQQQLKIAREVPIAVVEPRLGPSSSSHQDNSNISGQNWPSRAAAAAEEEVVLQQQQQQQQQQQLKIAREVPIAVVEPQLGPSSSSHQDISNISGRNWPSCVAAAVEEDY